MIKRSSITLMIGLLLSGCLQEEKRESRELDIATLDMQRMAMWHREYYFLVLRWRGKDKDSTLYYEYKMDSALKEYQNYVRRYDQLVREHKTQK